MLALVLLAVSLLFKALYAQEYGCSFQDRVLPCEDFENTEITFDDVGLVYDDEIDDFVLEGTVTWNRELDENMRVELVLFKQEAQGDILEFTDQGNFCDLLNDESSTCYKAVEIFNATSCPIKAGTTKFVMFTSLKAVQEILQHQHVGPHIMIVKYLDCKSDPLGVQCEEIACMSSSIEINEKSN